MLVVDVAFAVEIGDDDNAFLVVIIVQEPSTLSLVTCDGLYGEVGTCLGDSTIKKLPTASKPPIATCMRSGSLHAQ